MDSCGTLKFNVTEVASAEASLLKARETTLGTIVLADRDNILNTLFDLVLVCDTACTPTATKKVVGLLLLRLDDDDALGTANKKPKAGWRTERERREKVFSYVLDRSLRQLT